MLRVLVRTLLILALLAIVVVALLTQPLVTPIATEVPKVDTAQLRRHVEYLSVTAYPRSADQPKTLTLAAEYIERELAKSNCPLQSQTFPDEPAHFRNIVARCGPMTGPILVIGAHYDSFSDEARGARFPQGFDVSTHTPGADDNASAVAALIELTLMLSRSSPRIGVELVAYTREEPPSFRTDAMGSSLHARMARTSAMPIALMLSLETIGYYSDTKGSQRFPLAGLDWLYPDQGNFIAIVGRVQEWRHTRSVKALMLGATDLPVRSINALPALTGIDFSDHASYWTHGYPALMVTDTAFLRNQNYHQAGDTFDTLDYERMSKVVQAVYAVAVGFAAQ